MTCFFVSDLHGKIDRYEKLFASIKEIKPAAVFIGGDILPSGLASMATKGAYHADFINGFLISRLSELKVSLNESYPRIFIILGNDDWKIEEPAIIEASGKGIWEYINERKVEFGQYTVYGYSYVPPTPFLLKDWEKYDVSRYIDPGDVSPEEGYRSVPVPEHDFRYGTIKNDLNRLIENNDLTNSIFLFHAPPHDTKLDRIASDGKMVDHVPLDPHVGSIAIRKLIESKQPLITLHGHIHESARITGSWKDVIGKTNMFSAAHDGQELSLVIFDPENPGDAIRKII